MFGGDFELEAAFLALWEIGASGSSCQIHEIWIQLMLITNATVVTGESQSRAAGTRTPCLESHSRPRPGCQNGKRHIRRRRLARSQLLMPGGICAHTHFYGMFAAEWQFRAGTRTSGDP
jgi:hypothetical protein